MIYFRKKNRVVWRTKNIYQTDDGKSGCQMVKCQQKKALEKNFDHIMRKIEMKF